MLDKSKFRGDTGRGKCVYFIHPGKREDGQDEVVSDRLERSRILLESFIDGIIRI